MPWAPHSDKANAAGATHPVAAAAALAFLVGLIASEAAVSAGAAEGVPITAPAPSATAVAFKHLS